MRARLRQIHIDGHTFTWRAALHHVQVDGFYHRAVYVRAWGAGGKNSQKLEADLMSAPGPYVVDNGYPTPADVRAVIICGLKSGWQPEQRGGTFVLSDREHGATFTVPGFLLADPVRPGESAQPTTHEAQQRG
ncbi:integrase [Micromonospora arborensis]|uniref:Integrase n=1 Tax=Micromonospora arborensis TaxID=2116518 RepID=A0A318NEE1_9ACTN|nr:integrase [Micromonospora arborensis]PYC66597.1 integrase [Micromonospora arborensis]